MSEVPLWSEVELLVADGAHRIGETKWSETGLGRTSFLRTACSDERVTVSVFECVSV